MFCLFYEIFDPNVATEGTFDTPFTITIIILMWDIKCSLEEMSGFIKFNKFTQKLKANMQHNLK